MKKQNRTGLTKGACQAPHNSIFFSMDGRTFFCLANKEQVLGRYPEQSVDEMIMGRHTRSLRQSFLKDQFLPGCGQCEKHVEQGTESLAFMRFHEAYPPHPEGFPRYLDFELDNRCNLQCTMCRPYFSSAIRRSDGSAGNYKSPYEEAFYTAFDKYAPHIIKAHFRGGEPFLITRYHAFWEHLLKINPKIRIGATTNGTLMPDRVKTLVENHFFDINISIDSLEGPVWEKIRSKDLYDKYRENLDYLLSLKKHKKLNLTACICLMTLNWKEIPSIFAFCNEHGIAAYINYVEVPEYLSLATLASPDLAIIYEHLSSGEPAWNTPVSIYNKPAYEGVLLRIQQWKKSAGATSRANHYMLSDPDKARDEFFRALDAFRYAHPDSQYIQNDIIRQQIDKLKKFEEDGLPLSTVYLELVSMAPEVVFNAFTTLNDDEIDRKVLDKYFLILNTLRHAGDLKGG